MWSSSTPRKIFYIESRCDSALFLDTFSLHWTFFSHPLGWWLTGIAHSGTLGPQKGPESKPSGGANGLSGWVSGCASKEKINEFFSPPYHLVGKHPSSPDNHIWLAGKCLDQILCFLLWPTESRRSTNLQVSSSNFAEIMYIAFMKTITMGGSSTRPIFTR